MENILYADIELDSDDMFVVTPEGNYFNFPADKFNENSSDTTIIDPTSHKLYVVRFNE